MLLILWFLTAWVVKIFSVHVVLLNTAYAMYLLRQTSCKWGNFTAFCAYSLRKHWVHGTLWWRKAQNMYTWKIKTPWPIISTHGHDKHAVTFQYQLKFFSTIFDENYWCSFHQFQWIISHVLRLVNIWSEIFHVQPEKLSWASWLTWI